MRSQYLAKHKGEDRATADSREYRKAQVQATAAKWRAANKEKYKEIKRKWYAANKEKVLMRMRKYRLTNIEQINEKVKPWKRKNAAARKVTARLYNVPARLVKSLECAIQDQATAPTTRALTHAVIAS